jgi:SAM-dependent methyltransferase
MADKTKPAAAEPLYAGEIVLNEEKFQVAVNLNTIVEAEEITGDSVTVFATGNQRAKHTRALVYAALREGSRLTSNAKKPDPRITLEMVGAMLSTNNMVSAVRDIMQLLRKYRGEDSIDLAPFVPTPQVVLDAIVGAVPFKDKHVVDLGCGKGDVLLAALAAGATSVVGYEMDEDRQEIALARLRNFKFDNPGSTLAVSVLKEDLRNAALDFADVVFLYLLQDSNQKLRDNIAKSMKPGATVVSHDFSMDTWTPTQRIPVMEGDRTHTVFIYTIGENTPQTAVN